MDKNSPVKLEPIEETVWSYFIKRNIYLMIKLTQSSSPAARLALWAGGLLLVLFMAFSACGKFTTGKTEKTWFTMTAEEKGEQTVQTLIRRLELTPGQIKHLRKLIKEVLAKKEAQKNKAPIFHLDFIKQIRRPSLNRKLLDRLFEERHARIQEINDLFVDRMIEFHRILSPKQRNQMGDLLEDLNKLHKENW